jgi:hypothetical protein
MLSYTPASCTQKPKLMGKGGQFTYTSTCRRQGGACVIEGGAGGRSPSRRGGRGTLPRGELDVGHRGEEGRGQLGGNKVQGAAAKVDEVAVHQVMGKLGWGGAQGVTRPRAYHSF